MTNSVTPSVSQLRRAVELAEKISNLQSELDSLLSRGSQGSSSSRSAASSSGSEEGSSRKGAPRGPRKSKGGAGKRTMSPEAREKIAAAQRARWAKQKKDSK